jgi:hypothetical protein
MLLASDNSIQKYLTWTWKESGLCNTLFIYLLRILGSLFVARSGLTNGGSISSQHRQLPVLSQREHVLSQQAMGTPSADFVGTHLTSSEL